MAWILVCAQGPGSDQIESAGSLFKDGLYELSARSYREYLALFPGGEHEEDALYYTGLSLYRLKRFEESLSYFEKAAKMKGGFREDALYYLGESSYLVRQLSRSEKAFGSLLKEFPSSRHIDSAKKLLGRVNYLLGDLAFSRGIYSEALERYEAAASLALELSGISGFHAAQALARTGRLDEAKAGFCRLADDKATSGSALSHLARISLAAVLEESGRSEEAIKEYKNFMSQGKDLFFEFRAVAERGITRSLSSMGDDKKAADFWRGSEAGGLFEKGYAGYEEAFEHYLFREYIEAKEKLKLLINSRCLEETRVLAYRLLSRMEGEEGRTKSALELLLQMQADLGGGISDAALLEIAELEYDLGNWIGSQDMLSGISGDAEKWIRARAKYLDAEILYRQGEHEKAEAGFSAYLGEYPGGRDVALAYLLRGKLQAERGDDAGAINDLVQVKARGGRGSLLLRSYELLSEAYKREGLLDSALSAAGSAKDLSARLPTSKDKASEEQARLYFRKGDYAKGVEIFKELSKDVDAERRSMYLYEQGWAYYRLKEFDKAGDIFSGLAEGSSDWAVPAAVMLARIMESGGDLEGAMMVLEGVRSSDPYLASLLLYARARVRERAGDFSRALEHYQAIERDYPSALVEVRGPIQRCMLGAHDFQGFLAYIPGLEQGPEGLLGEDILLEKIHSAYQGGDLKELEGWMNFLEVTAFHEDPVEESRVLSSRLKITHGEKSAGLEGMKKVLSENPLSPFRDVIAFSLASESFQQKRCGEVLEYLDGLEPAHLSRKEVAWLLHMRGTCCENLGDMERMRGDFLSLVNEYPDVVHFPTQHLRVGVSLIKAGEYEEALIPLRQALVEVRDDASRAEAQYWIGECYQALGQYESSAMEYLKVSYLYPEQTMWSVTAIYQAAMVLVKLGQYEDAVRLLERVVNATRDSRQGEYAQKKLDELKEQLGK